MKTFLILSLLLVPAFAWSQGGSVGDVKYSILDPAAFANIHGSGWALMDGRNIQGTKLAQLTGRNKLPDARGMFLRSLNAEREDGNGDPDGERNAGSFQDDSFERHNHSMEPALPPMGHTVNGNGSAHRIDSDDGPSWNNVNVPVSTAMAGGSETRPKNIALYVYIKISD